MAGVKNRASPNNRAHLLSAARVAWDRGPRGPREKRRKYVWRKGASQVTQQERIRLPLQETQDIWVQSLGLEDPLEKEMATHSSIFACRIPWTEESGAL